MIRVQPNPAPLAIEAAVAVLGKDGRPILDYAQALAVLAALRAEAIRDVERAENELVSLEEHAPLSADPETQAEHGYDVKTANWQSEEAGLRADVYTALRTYLEVHGQAWAGELPDPWVPLLWQDESAHDDN